MCSQYEMVKPISEIIKLAKILPDEEIANLVYSPHVFPFAKAPVISRYAEYNSLRLMNYSLIPYWSTTAKPKFTTYNARLDRLGKGEKLELVYDAPTWRIPFAKQRCIVPLTGFFESCREGSHAGNVVKFTSASEDILWAAGVWDRWTDRDSGEIISSFAILTDEPCPFIRSVGHDRQPVFLDLAAADKWLDIAELPAKDAYEFLKTSQLQVEYSVRNYRQLKGYNSNDLFGGL